MEQTTTTPTTTRNFKKVSYNIVVVVCVVFICFVLTNGYILSCGEFYMEFKSSQKFEEEKQELPGQFFIACYLYALAMSTGILVGPIVNFLGSSWALMLSACLLSGSLLVISFVENLWILCPVVLFGLSFGVELTELSALMSVIKASHDIQWRLHVAVGVALSGSGVGAMFVFSPLMPFMIHQFSWRPTAMIESAVLLNVLVASVLLRRKIILPLVTITPSSNNHHHSSTDKPTISHCIKSSSSEDQLNQKVLIKPIIENTLTLRLHNNNFPISQSSRALHRPLTIHSNASQNDIQLKINSEQKKKSASLGRLIDGDVFLNPIHKKSDQQQNSTSLSQNVTLTTKDLLSSHNTSTTSFMLRRVSFINLNAKDLNETSSTALGLSEADYQNKSQFRHFCNNTIHSYIQLITNWKYLLFIIGNAFLASAVALSWIVTYKYNRHHLGMVEINTHLVLLLMSAAWIFGEIILACLSLFMNPLTIGCVISIVASLFQFANIFVLRSELLFVCSSSLIIALSSCRSVHIFTLLQLIGRRQLCLAKSLSHSLEAVAMFVTVFISDRLLLMDQASVGCFTGFLFLTTFMFWMTCLLLLRPSPLLGLSLKE